MYGRSLHRISALGETQSLRNSNEEYEVLQKEFRVFFVPRNMRV
jgi:hypothetical protein